MAHWADTAAPPSPGGDGGHGARPRRSGIGVLVLGGLLAAVLVGGGLFVLSAQRSGEAAEATVTGCARRVRATTCTGTWTTGDGRVVIGTIDGAHRDDIGETLDVRLDGDRAYTTSLRLPIVLIVTGLVLGGLGTWSYLAERRRS
ncbi:MAG TPA: hypothetical protein VIL36_02575 [Acidimicrobiales bacterium]